MQKKGSQKSDHDLLASLPVQVDHLVLKDKFSHYKNPQKKVFDLTQKGVLVPIKRGQYFNLKSEGFKSVHAESLANALYFPSYVSAQWALQYYGLLADRVHTITSVTTRRSAEFKTPIGIFSFQHLHKHRYPHGYVMQSADHKNFLMARPEKALLDYVNLLKAPVSWKTKNDVSTFLMEDLRIDIKTLLALVTLDLLKELLPIYHRNSKEHRILKWLMREKERTNG